MATALTSSPMYVRKSQFDESKHPRADDGKFGTGSGSPKKPIKFAPHPNQRDDETTILVDPKKIDYSWKKVEDEYLPPSKSGKSEVPGRRAGVEEFLKKEKPVEASRMVLHEGEVSFIDGRHRMAVMRDRGESRMAVTVPKDQAEEFKRRFGVKSFGNSPLVRKSQFDENKVSRDAGKFSSQPGAGAKQPAAASPAAAPDAKTQQYVSQLREKFGDQAAAKVAEMADKLRGTPGSEAKVAALEKIGAAIGAAPPTASVAQPASAADQPFKPNKQWFREVADEIREGKTTIHDVLADFRDGAFDYSTPFPSAAKAAQKVYDQVESTADENGMIGGEYWEDVADRTFQEKYDFAKMIQAELGSAKPIGLPAADPATKLRDLFDAAKTDQHDPQAVQATLAEMSASMSTAQFKDAAKQFGINNTGNTKPEIADAIARKINGRREMLQRTEHGLPSPLKGKSLAAAVRKGLRASPLYVLKNLGGPFRESEHPRDHGKFSEKPGASGKSSEAKDKQPSHHPGAAHGSSVTVKTSKQRAFDGKTPVQLKTPLTKQETGRVGEAVVLAYLKSQGFADAKPMNSAATNFPVDLIQDHEPTEVKAGLVSNGRKAQQWRLTFSKESAKEKALYDKMSVEQRTKWNEKKQQRIKERKEKVLAAIEKESGKKAKPRTITTVINPDTKTADIYVFDGWHDRIDWQSAEAKKAYKGSVTYAH